jgi:hypothetical protein
MAERVGFEPTGPFGPSVFKTVAGYVKQGL